MGAESRTFQPKDVFLPTILLGSQGLYTSITCCVLLRILSCQVHRQVIAKPATTQNTICTLRKRRSSWGEHSKHLLWSRLHQCHEAWKLIFALRAGALIYKGITDSKSLTDMCSQERCVVKPVLAQAQHTEPAEPDSLKHFLDLCLKAEHAEHQFCNMLVVLIK